MKNDIIGKPIDRGDGRLKVTGGAKYAAEFAVNNVVNLLQYLRQKCGNYCKCSK